MKPNFRITFSGKEKKKHIDVYAENREDALKMALHMPEVNHFRDVTVEEIPEFPCVIGIKFQYRNCKQDYCGYLSIKADSEKDAVRYYNTHFKGKPFRFDPGETEEDGKNIRGKVLETYFACCPGFDADATQKGALL